MCAVAVTTTSVAISQTYNHRLALRILSDLRVATVPQPNNAVIMSGFHASLSPFASKEIAIFNT